ncbi:DUF3302 domain-containing protein [Bradyrhizobium pachyrhizi]|uniref:DUF3302 domain-containing protein n=1 Tax=Bradyrhizobium pachyrhizi TaxID=280333 RepID=A0A844SJX3_9BRAD|nr:DUF3302 domain-containing protein [Bradyrhizobium pachyrhizi]MVT67298.1 DUF3302 domain-containing protein [Bradyrhizobium pachyrhizi]
MDTSFGILDAFAFAVFAVLIAVAVIIIVSLGQLPGRLAQQWGHPQASAVNVAGWIGIATGGLLWPLALIWAFIAPSGSDASKSNQLVGTDAEALSKGQAPLRKPSVDEGMRP